MTAKKVCEVCRSEAACIMCNGSGVYPYKVNPPRVKWGRCGVCQGDGIDHNYAGGSHGKDT